MLVPIKDSRWSGILVCSRSCQHSRDRAQDLGTTLEQLITSRTIGGPRRTRRERSFCEEAFAELVTSRGVGPNRDARWYGAPTPVRRAMTNRRCDEASNTIE